jgi:hypothetical protein
MAQAGKPVYTTITFNDQGRIVEVRRGDEVLSVTRGHRCERRLKESRMTLIWCEPLNTGQDDTPKPPVASNPCCLEYDDGTVECWPPCV